MLTTLHFDYGDLEWLTGTDGVRTAILILSDFETAWNPASATDLIYGPAFVKYVEHPEFPGEFSTSFESLDD